MKRILLVGVICLVFIVSAPGGYRAIANAANPRGVLPWKVEPLIQNTDVRISQWIMNAFLTDGAPLVTYHDQLSNKFRRDMAVGTGNGNCGVDNAWECAEGWWPISGYGELQQTSHFILIQQPARR